MPKVTSTPSEMKSLELNFYIGALRAFSALMGTGQVMTVRSAWIGYRW